MSSEHRRSSHGVASDEARVRDSRSGHEPPLGIDWARHYLRDLVYGANDGIITTLRS